MPPTCHTHKRTKITHTDTDTYTYTNSRIGHTRSQLAPCRSDSRAPRRCLRTQKKWLNSAKCVMITQIKNRKPVKLGRSSNQRWRRMEAGDGKAAGKKAEPTLQSVSQPRNAKWATLRKRHTHGKRKMENGKEWGREGSTGNKGFSWTNLLRKSEFMKWNELNARPQAD